MNWVEQKRSGPIRGSRDGGATKSKTSKSYVRDKIEDESSGEIANVKKSSASSKF